MGACVSSSDVKPDTAENEERRRLGSEEDQPTATVKDAAVESHREIARMACEIKNGATPGRVQDRYSLGKTIGAHPSMQAYAKRFWLSDAPREERRFRSDA